MTSPSQGKRVLYLTHDGLTDPLGQSQVLPYLKGLAARGYDITIISLEKRERFFALRDKINLLCLESRIDWVPLPYHVFPPLLSSAFDIQIMKNKALRLHRKKPFSLVHCRSYITSLVGLWLKNETGVPFVFDMRGFWADERVEGGAWSLSNVVYRSVYHFFKKREKAFLKLSDQVVVLTENARAIVSASIPAQKVTVIPCCVDAALFNETVPSNVLRKKLGISEHDFVLLYLGSVGTWYMMDEMVRFFNGLKRRFGSARFIVLTPDTGKITPSDDILVLTVPREEVPAYIKISDASVCFIRPTFSKAGSSATKMAEVLAMGVPVFTNAGWGDVDFLAGQIPGLHIVNSGYDWQGGKPEKVKQNGLFFDRFSLASGIAKYAKVYESAMNAQ